MRLGSTFKLVTLTALIEGNLATPSTTVDAPAQMTIGNASVTNADDIGWHHHARPGSPFRRIPIHSSVRKSAATCS